MRLTKARALLFLFLLAEFAAGCGGAHQAAADDTANAPAAAVVKVARRNIADSLEIASEFQPFQEVDIYAKVSGYIHSIPIFNGRLFSARRNEANSIAQAQEEYLRDLHNRIVRDVRTAWLNANSAFQRLAVTEQLLNESTQAFDLAQSRYGLGLSSIVELSQAQLNKTQAEIARVSAQYDYEGQIAFLNYQLGRMQ